MVSTLLSRCNKVWTNPAQNIKNNVYKNHALKKRRRERKRQRQRQRERERERERECKKMMHRT